jgi:hypothetical protein
MTLYSLCLRRGAEKFLALKACRESPLDRLRIMEVSEGIKSWELGFVTSTGQCSIWGFYSGGYEESDLLGYNVTQSIGSQLTFRRNLSSSSSGSRNRPSNKQTNVKAGGKQSCCLPLCDMFLQKVGWLSTDYTALHLRRCKSSAEKIIWAGTWLGSTGVLSLALAGINYDKILLNGNSSIRNLGIEFSPEKKQTISPLKFTKMIAVYSEYHTKPINIRWAKCRDF